MSTENKSWIPWVNVGFTEQELEHMKANPIKSTCGTCNRDTTGVFNVSEEFKCESKECPLKYW